MPADLIGAHRYAAFDPDLQVVWFLTEHACNLTFRDQQCQIRSLCTSRMRKMRRQPLALWDKSVTYNSPQGDACGDGQEEHEDHAREFSPSVWLILFELDAQ